MLHDDLLGLARRIYELDAGPGRPRQANLRRAISTAYYALFHLLVYEATSRMDLRGGEKNLGNSTARLLVLLDTYGAEALEAAVREVLARDVLHVHAVR